ncbi:MAG: hypothetical protein D6820_07860, partial [Lentisphaerae bacterium]
MRILPGVLITFFVLSGSWGNETSNNRLINAIIEKTSIKNIRLPDFSYCGYHYLDRDLPKDSEKGAKLFDVRQFGAVPNDGKSDRDAVLATLAAIHRQSGPAILYFPPGCYRLNEAEDITKPPVVIKQSHVIVRGAGSSRTKLLFSEPFLRHEWGLLIRSPRPEGYYFRGGRILGKVKAHRGDDLFSIEMEDASAVRPGMIVNIDADLNVNTPAGRQYFRPHQVPAGPR